MPHFVCALRSGSQSLWARIPNLFQPFQAMTPILSILNTTVLWKRNQDLNPPTGQVFAEQWHNPVDISTVLLIIAIDVIQKAFAQGAGKFYVPVCFSFGCVAYQFQALVNILGDGRLLPPPDYPCKVFNLDSGYMRESKNFVIGRLLRDLEAQVTRKTQDELGPNNFSLRITVFRARWTHRGKTEFRWTYLHLVGLAVTAIQFIIAAVPYLYHRDWSVLFITAVGTVLVQGAGILPQWRAEKLPTRQNSKSIWALTAGNGSRDIFVIIGDGKCIDLESLATSQTPRNTRPWEKFQSALLSKRKSGWPFRSFPWGFIITQISSSILVVLWLMLLIIISAPKSFPASWCLLAVGGLGMFQNAWLAAKELSPEERNIPLERVDQLVASKVMDGLMDFHSTYHRGNPLLREYFPGDLRPAERKWWSGDYTEYEDSRLANKARGEPRRRHPEKYQFEYPGDGIGKRYVNHEFDQQREKLSMLTQVSPRSDEMSEITEDMTPDLSQRLSNRRSQGLEGVLEETDRSGDERDLEEYRDEGRRRNSPLFVDALPERRFTSPSDYQSITGSTITMATWAI
ncbi:hypothetical protein QBC38DRAFT_493010 [Podospora fimiseda]|uniref:Uncharacterized protein n=1 Tax=Podospora fimiseda TaxID=252190 RepID=A0AAN6YLK7_9PEZI|nr:hypothetical protein QBC38DRAFT_493010 [Podospora fimiseda]